ncbi:MAG: SAM-dependent methyltransferase, partial [Paracoccaceae bacterium]|nr:SAM-dependent methyltransferase [Paracoccaceae bacterium]
MWELLLNRMLRLMILDGNLAVEMPSGAVNSYGNGAGELLKVRLRDKASVRTLVLNPELALG